MNGTETVDQLFALLFERPEGKEAAERFMEDHGDGNFIKGRYCTDVPPVPPTPADLLVLLQGSVVEGGGLPTKGRLRSSVQLHQRASVRYVACLIHV